MLTALQIKNLKPESTVYRKSDMNGLYLTIYPNGHKKWDFRYTSPVSNKRRTFRVGDQAFMSLSDARSEVIRLHQMISQGIDPVDQKREADYQRQQEAQIQQQRDNRKTFVHLYEEFANFCTTSFGGSSARWTDYTRQKHDERFANHVLPEIGEIPVEEVTEGHIVSILLAIQKRGTLSIRDKVKQVLNALFQYAFDKKYCNKNVMKFLPESIFVKPEVNHFKHLTTDKELSQFLQQLSSAQASFEVLCAIRLGVMFFLRPGELVGMQWHDVDFTEGVVTVFSSKIKKDHIVPMSDQAKQLLMNLNHFTGHSPYVFLSSYGSGRYRHISRDSLGNTLRRSGIDYIQPHGFRHTASTMLNEMGFDSDVIELQLSHKISGVRGVYNKAQRLKDRKALMQAWSDHLEQLGMSGSVLSGL
jgi:integrase